jgi:hypothetical protein
VDTLVSNWAYMVMASLAWSLKAWSALLVPVTPRHADKHKAEKRTLLRMEFATYCAAFIQMPCQIAKNWCQFSFPDENRTDTNFSSNDDENRTDTNFSSNDGQLWRIRHN